MLARMRNAIKAAQAAKQKPAIKAMKLAPVLDELEAGLREAIDAIETLAAAQYIIGRGTEAPADVLEAVRTIADPAKVTELQS